MTSDQAAKSTQALLANYRVAERILDLPSWLVATIEQWKVTLPADLPRIPLDDDRRQVIARTAKVYEAYLAIPADEASIAAWLEPLITAVEYPPSRDLFLGRVSGLMEALPDLPVLALNKRTRAAALSQFERWPSVAKLKALLSGEAARFRLELMAMGQLGVAAAKQAEERLPPTEEEIAAVNGMVADLVERFRVDQPKARRPTGRPVDPKILKALYQKEAADGTLPNSRQAARRRLSARDMGMATETE